jgi:hypothetical protein
VDVEETEVPTKDAVLMVKPNIVAVFGRALLYAQGDFLATRTYFISPAKKLKMDQLTSKQPRHFLTRSTQDE